MREQELELLLSRYDTPFYLFDLERLRSRVDTLRRVLPPGTALCYAAKANPFLLKEMADMVERLELCSPGEYAICQTLGLAPKKFVLSGVYKQPTWVWRLVERPESSEMILTVESPEQFAVFDRASRAFSRRLTLLLRLTSGNQFGLDREELERILVWCGSHPYLEVCGIQYFSGTQKTSVKQLRREVEELDGYLEGLRRIYGLPIRELEFGPGFPVTYFADGGPEKEDVLLEACTLLGRMRYSGKIILELGRSMTAGCGRYFTRVVDQKRNNGRNYAIVDGGVHQLVYYGQNLAMRRPKITLFPYRTDTPETWNICGSLCTINDILAKQVSLPGLGVGDVLIFENAGAYCMTEGIALFLSRDLPGILLRREGGEVTCVRESTPTCALNTPIY